MKPFLFLLRRVNWEFLANVLVIAIFLVSVALGVYSCTLRHP